MLLKLIAAIAIVCLSCFGTLADEPQASTRELLHQFSQNWTEDAWLQKNRRFPAGYMGKENDVGWQHRMFALQGCVQQEKKAIPLLLESLKSGDAPRRIFAAQTLGYLGKTVPAEPLVDALKSDADPAVRLYLVDSLGMLGHGEAVDWDEFLESEQNRDVKLHVKYVRERGEKPIDPSVVETLRRWDSKTIDSANIGQPAPNFTLTSAQGNKLRLSDYRGNKSVVLVFIYGDT